MKFSFDPTADAAYLALDENVQPGKAVEQVSFIETPNGRTQITVDFDADGYILGFEILGASDGISDVILKTADE